MFSLKNKVAIVTGARRGIGKGVAEVLAKAGAKVVISDIDQKDSERTAAQIANRYKVKTLAMKCDVSKMAEFSNLFKETIKKFKKVDILVNNAGILITKPFKDYTEEDWDKTLAVNLKSVFLGSKLAAKHMKKGKIVNIASIAGFAGYYAACGYCASKAGIINLTRELALELSPKININSIAPGAIETPMTSFMKKDKKLLQQTLAGIPWKRMGKPKDIGYAALFLCSDEADYVTGHTMVVDGGWTSGL
jgi:NAD(P)-dependent dehydrogenase (short-subunit alcohol dehydrogenase family)